MAQAKMQARTVQKTVLRTLLNADQCKEVSKRSMRGHLVVRVRRLCRIGRRVFVGFEIKNRARFDIFHLRRIEFGQEPGRTLGAGALVQLTGTSTLAFDEQVEGGALIAVEGATRWDYTLAVEENGSHPRRVVVDGISF